MVQAKAKRKIKAKVKAAKKVTAKSAARVRRAVQKASRHARPKASSLAKEFGDLADKIAGFGKAAFEQGAEKAGEIARAALSRAKH